MYPFLKRVKCALRGLKTAIYEEQSFRLQLVAATVVIILMFSFYLPLWKRVVLIFAIILVLGVELTNSIVERILDIIEAEHHPKIQDAKDIMGAAVLLSAVGAGMVGFLIFWPLITELF